VMFSRTWVLPDFVRDVPQSKQTSYETEQRL
jgi:hypothetical protein